MPLNFASVNVKEFSSQTSGLVITAPNLAYVTADHLNLTQKELGTYAPNSLGGQAYHHTLL